MIIASTVKIVLHRPSEDAGEDFRTDQGSGARAFELFRHSIDCSTPMTTPRRKK
ncbi:hypothetical protein [Bradyrhizobium sp. Gha]|uniref:hypothetical protein n=1 Tax=Bradyrhizobium sp. Gha TaxID=1855318 RepID=UPI0015A6EB25|nr:hypothetical protein [Bradyrhizobium sp. Gha]